LSPACTAGPDPDEYCAVDCDGLSAITSSPATTPDLDVHAQPVGPLLVTGLQSMASQCHLHSSQLSPACTAGPDPDEYCAVDCDGLSAVTSSPATTPDRDVHTQPVGPLLVTGLQSMARPFSTNTASHSAAPASSSGASILPGAEWRATAGANVVGNPCNICRQIMQ